MNPTVMNNYNAAIKRGKKIHYKIPKHKKDWLYYIADSVCIYYVLWDISIRSKGQQVREDNVCAHNNIASKTFWSKKLRTRESDKSTIKKKDI